MNNSFVHISCILAQAPTLSTLPKLVFPILLLEIMNSSHGWEQIVISMVSTDRNQPP